MAVIAPEQAAGLVPLDQGQKSKLEQRVGGFIGELVALDANSPEFGKKVDQIMIGWARKSDEGCHEALMERERPRIGRRARVAHKVEFIADATPSIGRMIRTDQRKRRSPKTS